MIKVKWETEEMVAMVDLYFRSKNDANIKEEISMLHKKLNARAEILKINRDLKFRNENGLKIIYENIRYVDTDGERGLGHHSKLIEEVVELYKTNQLKFQDTLRGFNSKYQ